MATTKVNIIGILYCNVEVEVEYDENDPSGKDDACRTAFSERQDDLGDGWLIDPEAIEVATYQIEGEADARNC